MANLQLGGMPNHERIKEIVGGAMEPVYLSRDLRTGSIVVSKVFRKRAEGASDFEEYNPELQISHLRQIVAIYPDHERLVRIREILDNTPEQGDYTVIMDLCNAGTFSYIQRHAKRNKKLIPESLIYHIINGVLDGLVALKDAGLYHGDAHPGNVFLHVESRTNSRHIVEASTLASSFPETKLGDYQAQQASRSRSPVSEISMSSSSDSDSDQGGPLVFSNLAKDLYKFFSGVWVALEETAGELGTPMERAYSSDLIRWTSYLSLQSASAPSRSYEQRLEELRRELPRLVADAGPETLPEWLIAAFLEENANLLDDSDEARNKNSEKLGAEPVAPGIPSTSLPTARFVEACEVYLGVANDDEYRRVFDSNEAQDPTLDMMILAKKLAWLGNKANVVVRTAAHDFENMGRSGPRFNRVVQLLDLGIELYARTKRYSLMAVDQAIGNTTNQAERKPWNHMRGVLEGGVTVNA